MTHQVRATEGAALLARQARSLVGERLDVLVSNAGVSKAALLADYTVRILTSSSP